MQATTRAFLKRAGAACTAAAILIGGTLNAGAASATPAAEPTPRPTASQSSPAPTPAAPVATAERTAPPSAGLAEALKRDLDMSLADFNAQGALAAQASVIQAEVARVDPNALVTLTDDIINVRTTATDVAERAAAGSNVSITALGASAVARNATNVEALFADYISTFGAENLMSVAVTAGGEYVIRTGDLKGSLPRLAAERTFAPSLTASLQEFAARYANVVVEGAVGPATPTFEPGDSLEVINGQGFAAINAAAQAGTLCSTGWNGFNKSGAPAIISAGHCTMDGLLEDAILTNPLADKAVTGDSAIAPAFLAPLGTLGFSQFGGLGNGTTTAPAHGWNAENNIGTDVSVIDSITAGFTLTPKVAKWTGASAWSSPEQVSSDPTNVKVTAIASPVLGAPVCKSGRTTAWTCGVVDEIGAYAIAGINYPSAANPHGDPLDIRAVRGFASITNTMMNDHGDSGGPVISGTTAVGITSAGGELNNGQFLAIAADLKTALGATDGYTVKIYLNAPALTTTAPLFRLDTITGTVAEAPDGTEVIVTLDGVTTAVPVGADGAWSVAAPNKVGTFAITAQTRNGFSTSAVTEAVVEVIKETLSAPTFTFPAAQGAVTAPVAAITGTGTVGAVVELSGDATGTAIVDADGTWSVTMTPALTAGSYTVIAKQTMTDWNDSPTASRTFKVIPTVPAIIFPSNGQQFKANASPSVVSGRNIPGAAVTVTIGTKTYQATVVGSTWSVGVEQPFGSGKHSVSVVQSVGGAESMVSNATFTVLAAPAPAATSQATQVPSATPAPAAPGSVRGLAATGTSRSLAFLGVAGVLLLLGGGAVLIIRRRGTR